MNELNYFSQKTDLGQSSLYIPGTVNLFLFENEVDEITNLSKDPNYHRKPILSYYMGEFSPQNHIDSYLEAIKECIQFYRTFYSNCPLVINTHGYITNIGEIIFYDILKITQPQIVVNLFQNKMKGSSEKMQNIIGKNNFCKRISYVNHDKDSKIQSHKNKINLLPIQFDPDQINKSSVNNFKRVQKDKIILSYFYQNQQNKKSFFKSNPIIMSLLPSYSTQIIDISFYLMRDQEQNGPIKITNAFEIAQIFIGSLVALYQLENYQLSDINILSKHNCRGLGFIKDFDLEQKLMYIITPELNDTLDQINSVVKSRDYDFSNDFYLQDAIENSIFQHSLGNSHFSTQIFTKQENRAIGGEQYKQRISSKKN